jgi:hypothetical protein
MGHNVLCTVNLLALDALDVDDPLATVDLNNLALTALEGTTSDDNLVILTDGHRLDLKKQRTINIQTHP